MSAERIEQALTYWEDICALERHLAMLQALRQTKPFEPEGPLKYLGFRHVLKKGLGWSNEFCYNGDRPALKAMSLLPVMLYGWMYASKRVFRVSDEMMTKLLNGAHQPSRCAWGEFPWPFEAFAISFETPVRVRGNKDGSYDTVLVVNVPRAGRVSMRFQYLPIQLNAYQPMGDKELDQMAVDIGEEIREARTRIHGALPRKVRRALKRQKGPSLVPAVQEMLIRTNGMIDGMITDTQQIIDSISPLALLMERGLIVDRHDLGEQISDEPHTRFIHSLCDLIARGVSTVGGGSSRPSSDTSGGDSIAEGANLFEVGSQSEFATGVRIRQSPDEPSGRTVRPHPRRGYYRRVRGSAPDAPKTEWVDSTWIHRDEAKARSLIPVSETVINALDDNDKR